MSPVRLFVSLLRAAITHGLKDPLICRTIRRRKSAVISDGLTRYWVKMNRPDLRDLVTELDVITDGRVRCPRVDIRERGYLMASIGYPSVVSSTGITAATAGSIAVPVDAGVQDTGASLDKIRIRDCVVAIAFLVV